MIHIIGKQHDLGGGLIVNRVLPDRKKRMVGPFTFLDHMGPLTTNPGQETDVRPHPHIGLSTLTYLFDGRIVHRDSLGSVVEINPGEVNWMTAGKGITHSERAPDSEKGLARRLHGLQIWIALPIESEDCEPSFNHYKNVVIPKKDTDQCAISVIAGEAFGLKSPVVVSSPLVFVEIKTKKQFDLKLHIPGFELALYLIKGTATTESQSVSESEMITTEPGQELNASIEAGAHVVVLGGAPIGERFIWWNLVSSSKEKIELAKKDWANGKFPKVPSETEFIPLPNY